MVGSERREQVFHSAFRPGPGAVALRIVAVLLIAVGLRSFISSVGSVLGGVRAEFAVDTLAITVVAAAPLFAFGLVGLAAPRVGRRWGLEHSLLAASALTAASLLLRPWFDWSVFVVGTVVACVCVAVVNVLIPAVVKRDFARLAGPVTGAYTAVLVLGGAGGAAVTPRVVEAWGVRGALFAWGLLAAAGALLWVLAYVVLRPPGAAPAVAGEPLLAPTPLPVPGNDDGAPDRTDGHAPADDDRTATSALVWLSAVFGCQALVAYALMTWLPEMLQAGGVAPVVSADVLALSIVIGAPWSIMLPTLAMRVGRHELLFVGLGVVTLVGLLGVLVAPARAPFLIAALLGVGNGVFPLTILMFVLRTRRAAETSRVSGIAQGVGYLVAAFGALGFGALGSLDPTWELGLVFLVVVTGVQTIAGYQVGRGPRDRDVRTMSSASGR